jgi:hypothetical protein
MKQYVLSKEKSGYNKTMQNVYDNRLRDYALQALKDLALLAEKLPEDQQAQIFNAGTTAPLFQGLFTLAARTGSEKLQTLEDLLKTTDPNELENKRSRILLLCKEAVDAIAGINNAHNLAPYEMRILLDTGSSDGLPALTAIKAVYIKAFGSNQSLLKRKTRK